MCKWSLLSEDPIAVVEDDSYLDSTFGEVALEESVVINSVDEGTSSMHRFLKTLETIEGIVVKYSQEGVALTSRAVKIRSVSSNYALILSTIFDALDDDIDTYSEDTLFVK